ncbi:MAG: DUF4416 family protein [Bacteriovoracaceae bacterium]
MSELVTPSSVLLFSSVLFLESEGLEQQLFTIFQSKFGRGHLAHHPFCPMKKYYSQEMGDIEKLKRVFFFSHNLFPRDTLVEAKKWAIDIENSFLINKKRTVNFDVGLISLENLQLATGKMYAHRVYLRDNIYSDLTLIFQNNSYQTLPWSYPDYSHPEIINIFNWNRRLLQTFLEEKSDLSS